MVGCGVGVKQRGVDISEGSFFIGGGDLGSEKVACAINELKLPRENDNFNKSKYW